MPAQRRPFTSFLDSIKAFKEMSLKEKLLDLVRFGIEEEAGQIRFVAGPFDSDASLTDMLEPVFRYWAEVAHKRRKNIAILVGFFLSALAMISIALPYIFPDTLLLYVPLIIFILLIIEIGKIWIDESAAVKERHDIEELMQGVANYAEERIEEETVRSTKLLLLSLQIESITDTAVIQEAIDVFFSDVADSLGISENRLPPGLRQEAEEDLLLFAMTNREFILASLPR